MAEPLAPRAAPRVLVAAVGNVIAGDDGFGPAVLAALSERPLPDGVRLMDAGIGGFALVRELMDGYDALIVIDAMDRGLAPGALRVLEPVVPDIASIQSDARAAAAGDMHQAVPGTALIVARAAGALPAFVRIVGCQPLDAVSYHLTLSDPVRAAVPAAASAVCELIASCRAGATVRPPATLEG